MTRRLSTKLPLIWETLAATIRVVVCEMEDNHNDTVQHRMTNTHSLHYKCLLLMRYQLLMYFSNVPEDFTHPLFCRLDG